MGDINRLIYIGADPHPANQGIVFADEKRTSSWKGHGNQLTFYGVGSSGNRSAAFRLIPDSSGPNHSQIPLIVSARFSVDQPGNYRMEAGGSGPSLYSTEFALEKGFHTKEIGPFSAEIHANCPFRATINDWNIVERSSRQKTCVSDVEMDIYFFLGSVALPLEEFPNQEVHVEELIKRTIPLYEEIEGKSFAEVESQVVGRVVYSFWKLGEADFCYDSTIGACSFFGGGHFQLGRMLKKQARTCNCFDMAALVYAGLKSFGRRPSGGPGWPETDVFEISIHRVENWGFIYPGTLFGFGGTANELANNPFWQLQPGNQISMVDPNDPNREPFGQHCFTLLRNSGGQERVVDLCLAVPDGSPEAAYSDCQHLFHDGWCDLKNYQAHTDKGWYEMKQGDLQNVPITSISIQVLPEDKRCREIWTLLNRLAIMKIAHYRVPGALEFNELPHWCFRPEDAQEVQQLINELRLYGRIPYFGSQP